MKRRTFIQSALSSGAGIGLSSLPSFSFIPQQQTVPVGIIGLDTSHSPAFARILNADNPAPEVAGYRVVAAYPYGSKTIKSSYERIPKYTEDVEALGVEIVDSIEALLQKAEVVLLETNDGNPHLEQALPVLKAGKRLFIDKPVAAHLKDVLAIYEAAEKYGTPVFSSSSLRYTSNIHAVRHENKIGEVVGADTFSPASLEPSHTDLFWYGIHGVEPLFAVMGTGCKTVQRIHTEDTDIVVGIWEDGRIGTFRGTRSGKHNYGGIAFGTEGNVNLGPYEGYEGLVHKIIEFFRTGKPPVDSQETLEIYAFMEAADVSKQKGGDAVDMQEVMKGAKS